MSYYSSGQESSLAEPNYYTNPYEFVSEGVYEPQGPEELFIGEGDVIMLEGGTRDGYASAFNRVFPYF